MGITCGIVGLPNVGKSTLFNALTKAKIDAANYPFCTIEPNVGIVPVPDQRLDTLAGIVNPEKVIPTTVEFVDIAGLVAGASKGEGLGNKFLANIRETDAIAHVVRCFENGDVVHVSGQVDPISDIETINTELLLADMDTISKALQKVEKNAKSGNKEEIAKKELFSQLKIHVDKGLPARTFMNADNAPLIRTLHLLTSKPVLYIANVAEDNADENPFFNQVKTHAEKEQAEIVPVSAQLEAEIADLADEEKAEFLAGLGMTEPGLDRVIHAAYRLLHLQTYFTAGEKEVRAWTVRVGAKAPQAAGVIHTDFEKGFIRAEVIGYDDYITYNGEQGAKDAGKWRLEGKDYVVQDGDVVHFRFNN